MTVLRSRPSLTTVATSNGPSSGVPASGPRAEPATRRASPDVVTDHFEAAGGRTGRRNEQLVAGNVVGVVAAFVLNGVAIVGGVSHSLTGLGPSPTLRRQEPHPTELVVPTRGLPGA
jgi:hypothetical protein